MLINGWSGSGGDAFPFYFREAVDGGGITVPTFRMYDPKSAWFAEGHGVDPDIPVEDNPSQLAKGTDPQLQRAIEEINKRIASAPKTPAQPAYEKRTP